MLSEFRFIQLSRRLKLAQPAARFQKLNRASRLYVKCYAATRKPKGYWESESNQKQFLDDLGKKLGVQEPSHWYLVSKSDVERNEGVGLIAHFGKSFAQAIMSVYTNHIWHWWRFNDPPKLLPETAFNEEQLKLFCDHLSKKYLKIQSPEDWYSVTSTELGRTPASILLTRDEFPSLEAILRRAYPNHRWLSWEFSSKQVGWWKNHENQLQFMKWATRELCADSMDGWYSVNANDLRQVGGGPILQLYADSVPKVLHAVFPSHTWQDWLFPSLPRNYWVDKTHRKAYFDWLATKLNVKQPEDWKFVTREDVYKNHGGGLLTRYYGSSVSTALRDIYPEVKWNEMDRVKASSQVS